MIEAISAVTLGTHEMGPNNRRAAGPTCLRYFDPVSALQRHIKADAAPIFSATTIHSGIPVRCVYNFSLEQATPFLENVPGREMDAAENCSELAALSRCSAFPSVFAALSRWNWKLAGWPCHGAQELAVLRRC